MIPALNNISKTGRYSTTEAASLLGVNRSTLSRWLERGVIKCGYRRHNNRRFYEGSELIRFFNSRAL